MNTSLAEPGRRARQRPAPPTAVLGGLWGGWGTKAPPSGPEKELNAACQNKVQQVRKGCLLVCYIRRLLLTSTHPPHTRPIVRARCHHGAGAAGFPEGAGGQGQEGPHAGRNGGAGGGAGPGSERAEARAPPERLPERGLVRLCIHQTKRRRTSPPIHAHLVVYPPRLSPSITPQRRAVRQA